LRHVIQTALVFNSSQPEYLVIEYGDDGAGRMIGQYFTLEDAFKGAHERAGERPQLTVIENPKRIKRVDA
jgi:hypothetical protein